MRLQSRQPWCNRTNVNAVQVLAEVVILTSFNLGDLLLGCGEYTEKDQLADLSIEPLLPPGGRLCN